MRWAIFYFLSPKVIRVTHIQLYPHSWDGQVKWDAPISTKHEHVRIQAMMTDLTMANLTIISKKLVSQSSNEDLNSVTFKRYELSTTHHAILQSFNQTTTIPSPVTSINAKWFSSKHGNITNHNKNWWVHLLQWNTRTWQRHTETSFQTSQNQNPCWNQPAGNQGRTLIPSHVTQPGDSLVTRGRPVRRFMVGLSIPVTPWPSRWCYWSVHGRTMLLLQKSWTMATCMQILRMLRVLADAFSVCFMLMLWLARLTEIRQAVLRGLDWLSKDEFGEFYANLASLESLANLESVG